jgi:tetratricopeptide (TPR) repeat protein
MTLNHLAVIYHWTDRRQESEEMYRRVLAMRRAAWGDRHVSVGSTRVNLASVLIERGGLGEAAELLKTALVHLEELPQARLERAHALLNLAILDSYNGELELARRRALEVTGVMEALMGADHPWSGKALLVLGEIQLRLARYSDAEGSLRRSVQVFKKSFSPGKTLFSPGHPILMEAMLAHAEALRKCGQKREAKQVEKEARSNNATLQRRDSHRQTVSFRDLGPGGKR